MDNGHREMGGYDRHREGLTTLHNTLSKIIEQLRMAPDIYVVLHRVEITIYQLLNARLQNLLSELCHILNSLNVADHFQKCRWCDEETPHK